MEAWDLQRSLAAAVAQGAIPDTVVLLEHPPTVTLGRRTDEGEVHVPTGADVEVVETDRGGKSTYHGPGQLVCYPILDLNRHGKDVKRYCRDLEEAIIRTLAAFGVEATRIDGLTGVWLERPPRKIASIGVHISPLGHDPRLRAQRRPRPGAVHRVDHGVRARGRGVHVDRARARPAGHGRRGAARARSRRSPTSSSSASRSSPATSAGLWAQPMHAQLAPRATVDSAAMESSLPVAERPRRPEWMKVRAPSADTPLLRRQEADPRRRACTRSARRRAARTSPSAGAAAPRRSRSSATPAPAPAATATSTRARPSEPVDPLEPLRLAQTAAQMGLKHVVVTSVDRDDVPDRGAGHYAATIRALRRSCPTRRSRC